MPALTGDEKEYFIDKFESLGRRLFRDTQGSLAKYQIYCHLFDALGEGEQKRLNNQDTRTIEYMLNRALYLLEQTKDTEYDRTSNRWHKPNKV